LNAKELVAQMDAAGIRRAAVLSIAYQFGNPNRPPVEKEYERVKAENDWTREQAALYPKRLTAICSSLFSYKMSLGRIWILIQDEPGGAIQHAGH
jgi:hypothetical protein